MCDLFDVLLRPVSTFTESVRNPNILSGRDAEKGGDLLSFVLVKCLAGGGGVAAADVALVATTVSGSVLPLVLYES